MDVSTPRENTTLAEADDLHAVHSDFEWREVDCYLRPQALLCERMAPGHGRVLLCLASLYRTWGANGFYVRPGLGHFAFLATRFREATGVQFHVGRAETREALVEALCHDWPRQPGMAIVPTNIRGLPHFLGCGKQDRRHYFLLRGFDHASRSFQVLDYLHVQEDNQSLCYSPFSLPADLLASLACHYWDRYVERGVPDPGGELGYWILRGGPEPGPVLRSPRELAELVLRECQRVLRLVDTDPAAVAPLDARFLARLSAAYGGAAPGELERVSHDYYSAVNHSRVYLKVALHALAALGHAAAADRLASELAGWERSTGVVRTQLLMKCRLGRALGADAWSGFAAKLALPSERLRNAAMEAIGAAVPA